ncbi:MAG: hypothetical protein AMS24_03400 [Chlamydiae bacterium SM23_39]|nr:MAG: hypothetical protein AMS24_03400 [Chlamydiae bacterium SM23_39]
MKNQLITISHKYWKDLLKPNDNVIDATCGNGYDSLFLSSIIKKGFLFCIDIQKKAIENTYSLLKEKKCFLKNIFLLNCSHTFFSPLIKNHPIKLITYNLGYLPGFNKKVTTKANTTLLSLKNALPLITPNGAISIMCYTGHAEGKIEKKQIFSFLSTLSPISYTTLSHDYINKKNSPCFIWIVKNPLHK